MPIWIYIEDNFKRNIITQKWTQQVKTIYRNSIYFFSVFFSLMQNTAVQKTLEYPQNL